jgi:hypothetical protein
VNQGFVVDGDAVRRMAAMQAMPIRLLWPAMVRSQAHPGSRKISARRIFQEPTNVSSGARPQA